MGTWDGSAHDWCFTLFPVVTPRLCAPGSKQLGTRVGYSYVWSFLFPVVTARRCTPGSKQLGTRVGSVRDWCVTLFPTVTAVAVLQVAGDSWGLGLVQVMPGS